MPVWKDLARKPSEDMNCAMEQTSGAGSCRVTCEFCGRTHFNGTHDWDWDEGELEELLAKAKSEPDRFLDHDYTPTWCYLDGKVTVAECPCNAASRYETLFWQHRVLIANYIERRAKSAREAADAVAKISGKLAQCGLRTGS